jgi:putative NIF3 family GTP cyclohydrolase 1 type 2
MQHNANLFAYHLPLDSHPEVGNNAQLGKKLRLKVLGQHPTNSLRFGSEIAQKTLH